jgi:hypothetical protein
MNMNISGFCLVATLILGFFAFANLLHEAKCLRISIDKQVWVAAILVFLFLIATCTARDMLSFGNTTPYVVMTFDWITIAVTTLSYLVVRACLYYPVDFEDQDN